LSDKPRGSLALYVLITLAAAGSIALFGLGMVSFLDNNCTDLSGKDICQHILFIGNSYTYVNDLPGTFNKLARSGGHPVQVEVAAEGGWTLADHAASSATLEKIRSRKWDYVVLQDQSQGPASPDFRIKTMYPAARKLIQEVKAAGSKPVLFLTWAHKDGWPENNLPGYDAMQEQITLGYLELGMEQGIPVVPVGVAWANAYHQNPDLTLWQDDGSHPSPAGTYLAACAFYTALYGRSPVGLAFYANLPVETAQRLQTAAGDAVLNDLARWNLK
jgi:hypothetical protein